MQMFSNAKQPQPEKMLLDHFPGCLDYDEGRQTLPKIHLPPHLPFV
jgi:hypothetical protein